MRAGESRQYIRLIRHFAYRLVDNELIAADGQIHQTLTSILAILGGLSFTITVSLVLKYFFRIGEMPEPVQQLVRWSDQEFQISLTMAVIGFFGVMAWDSLFPDRKDSLVLGPLPVRWQVMLRAKLTAILLILSLMLVLTVSFSGLLFPLLMGPASFGQLVRFYLAYWLTLIAAGLFVFFSLFAIQGVLILTLPYRWFLRVSAWVQMTGIFVVLLSFTLSPNVEWVARGHERWAQFLPNFWFLDLYQLLAGTPHPLSQSHAIFALALPGIVVLSLALYTAGYRRAVQKTVEESEVTAARRHFGPGFMTRLIPSPRRRAVFQFVARTMLRNRRHRLLLAVYAGLGLAFVSGSLGWMVKRGTTAFLQPTSTLLSVPLDLAFFLLLGMRALFAIPVELPANWIFRFTEGGEPSDYLGGVRTFLWVVGLIPLSLLPLPVYGMLWGWTIAVKHTFFTASVILLFVEMLLWNFRKIPFTCSYLPGRANLKVTLGVYSVIFLAISALLSSIDMAVLRSSPAGFLKFAGVVTALILFVFYRRGKLEQGWPFQFEERADWWMTKLELSR